MKHTLIVLCFAVTILTTFATQIYDGDVSSKCMMNCNKNGTDFGDICSANATRCHEKCQDGCFKWKESLNNSCQMVCNSSNSVLTPEQIYCLIGCNDGVAIFRDKMESHLGIPPPPVLVADSLTSTTLQLEWHYKKADIPGLKYLIQWKYEDIQSSWQFYKKTNWMSQDSIFTVDDLQPYTKYRFRVAILIYQLSEPVYSSPSVVIMSFPKGAPLSPPSSVRAVPLDCTRISVSWEPGAFPNGPILSYVVGITELNTNISAFKDVPAEKHFDIISSLKAGAGYNVSVRVTNSNGTGPAAYAFVTTPIETTVKDTQGPVLIIGTDREIVEQGVDILDEPIILYNTAPDVTIKGVAIHVKYKLLFISDSERYIYKMPLSQEANYKKVAMVLPSQINFQPLDLSVDWLNEQLYILAERRYEVNSKAKIWSIMRCGLDGQSLTVAVGGLHAKPHHIEVDPYNGYLFWIVNDWEKSNLYKLDLSDISNGIKHENHPELIFSQKNLGAFIVDHTNFNVLVSNQNKRTVNSVSLDGKEVQDIRPRVSNSILQKVISLATANKKFYWTDGSLVFCEEYHAMGQIYFHNSFSALMRASYLKVIINMPSSQPVPVPVNPPTQIQSIFGSSRAKINWKVPHLLGGQGKGAWQNWSYEISVKNPINKQTHLFKSINSTSFTIGNLAHDTDYVIKAAAYTSSGKGPWSSEFRGRTLKHVKNVNHPIVLWSASNGLSKSDVIGENMETLIDISQMKNFYFMESAWYKDEIYLLTNTSEVYIYNLTSHQERQLPKLDNDIKSVAIDWIGQKLYWSKQQWIMRANLGGTNKEPPIAATANELVIDSLRAYLYWSTGYTITCSRLNGDTKLIHYYVDREFSGKRVMGLTLDTDNKYVYWIVRGSEGSNLFRGPLAGTTTEGDLSEMVSSLQKADIKGSLSYFNNRFLWVQDDDNAVIGNMEGRNLAVINGESLSGESLYMVDVVDPALRLLQNKSILALGNINVLPNSVDIDSITVVGTWDSFNITWKQVNNVNFGNVFYEVKFPDEDQTKIVYQPTIKFPYEVLPFSDLHVWIKACTYWTSSLTTKTFLHSPSSAPTEPQNLRTYVTYSRNFADLMAIKVTIRWDEPLYSNGVIEKYKVSCWIHHDDSENNGRLDVCKEYTLADCKEFVLNNLFKDRIYYFEVQAYTENEGSSAKIQVNTSMENPIPTLVVASEDSIYIDDLDSNKTKVLLPGISAPMKMAVLMREKKLFWLNDMPELFMYDMESGAKSRILDMSSQVVSLTVDWLERSLFYIQYKSDVEGSVVYKLDLNLFKRNNNSQVKPVQIFRTPSKISRVEVSPFTKKLYWIETDQNNRSNLMECGTDGTKIRPFFNHLDYSLDSEEMKVDCNCPVHSIIEKVFTVDHSNQDSRPSLIFIESSKSSVNSADKHGCNCKQIANISMNPDNTSLKSDLNNLHWIDYLNQTLHSFEKRSGILKKDKTNAKEILIFGEHVQPFPPRKCLQPELNTELGVSLVNKTSHSLTLQMPDAHVHKDCKGISVATIEYRLHYMPFNDDQEPCDETCTLVTTFDKTISIGGLRPYSHYIFFLDISNYFISLEENVRELNNFGKVFQTAVGAPSEPRSTTVTVLNPTLLKVSWLPPEDFNGDTIYYEIHWQTEATASGIRQKGEQIVMENDITTEQHPFTANLRKMSQNQTYLVWVRAYSQNNESSDDSPSVKVTTFPEPDNITVINYTACNLDLEWKNSSYVSSFIMQYTQLTSNDWGDVPSELMEYYNESIVVSIDGLKPKTQYKFRFLLKYPEYEKNYVWPQDARFTFETRGDRPTPPGKPEIRYIKGNESRIWWQPSKDNGAPVELYRLEGLRLRNSRERRSTNRSAWFYGAPSIEEPGYEWEEFYNGTETYWQIEGLSDEYRYSFRALALNEYGWSDPSEDTEFNPKTFSLLAERPDPLTMVVVAICIPLLILICVIVMCSACCRWNCSKNKKDPHIIAPARRPDVELATLRELPRRSNFIQNTNVLYVSAQPTPEEIRLLPHIRRDQITLTKFLGSGAFGEVYEGKARGVADNDTELKVAVKTLRKGASDQEKTEFLQEAQLMSHFKHQHILQLLGVCLDNDPHYIIMELMEGGDLLTYLRSSRNTTARTPPLTLVELLKMCVDVTTGCRYLEEMHFVHRDLACRNCLVSSSDPESRIVKIGDFGLARDIYKNDYYRKEGEGLLPVRWMAPESLVDGVFTSQSDVWSFGVLLWEIMTLGQQPYPARNNLEVLHYVRRGGRLGKPTDCPEKLHELMLLCWSFEPEARPTFKYCLDTLTRLHEQVLRSPATSAHSGQYISTVPDHLEGVSNQLYFQDLNHNHSGTSWKSDSSSRERTPFLTSDVHDISEISTEIPKYLEIVHDGNSEENDGYEVPRKDFTDLDINSEEVEENKEISLPSDGCRDSVKLRVEVNTNKFKKT